jgi:hypothetical protein
MDNHMHKYCYLWDVEPIGSMEIGGRVEWGSEMVTKLVGQLAASPPDSLVA